MAAMNEASRRTTVYVFINRSSRKFRPFRCCSIINGVIEVNIQASVNHLVSIWKAVGHQAIWTAVRQEEIMTYALFRR